MQQHLEMPASMSRAVHSRAAERMMQSPFLRRGSAQLAAAAAGSSHCA